MSLNKPNELSVPQNQEFDWQEVLTVVKKYKISIVSVILFMTIVALLYTVVTAKIFQADLQLQIKAQMMGESGGSQTNVFDKAFEVKGENLDNEIAVIQSHYVINRAIEKVPTQIRYFNDGGIKSTELYKNSPFTVQIDAYNEVMYNYLIHLVTVDDKHFRIIIKPSLPIKIVAIIRSMFGSLPVDEKPVYFEGTFQYGEQINTALFSFNVIRNFQSRGNYSFRVIPNDIIVKNIQKNLVVAPVSDKSSVLMLSYQDSSSERAHDVLNAIADAYEEQNIQNKKASARKTLSFIDEELKQLNHTLQKSASELQNYKSNHALIDPKEKAIMTTQQLNGMEAQKNELEMQKSVYEKLLKDVKENRINGIDTGTINIQGSPLLALIEKLHDANTLRSSLLVDYTEQHPSVVKATKQIESLKSNIIGTINSILTGIKQREEILNTIMNKNLSVLNEVPEEEIYLENLTNNFLLNQKNYEYLLQKRAEVAIAESATVSTVNIIDSAMVREFPVKPVPILNFVLGLTLGLIFGLMQAFVRNHMSDTIHGLQDIEKNSSIPVYATLPELDKIQKYEDALRVFFTKIEFDPAQPKIINFTSSVAGEGRTTTVLKLADIIGQSGKKVLVIDFDLRAPKIHTSLGLQNNDGISNILSGDSEFETAVQKLSDYDVILSGTKRSNAYALLISKNFKILMERIKNEYDYIIVESSPISVIADALVLMRQSDINIIVVKSDYSKKASITALNRFVKEHNVESFGIILNVDSK